MSIVTAKALFKGTGIYTSKKSKDEAGKFKEYFSMQFYGVDGSPADFSADLDMTNGGKLIYDKWQKLGPQMCEVKMDLTFYNRQARFKVISCEPVK